MSAGNHAAGLAYAASVMGVQATIVMPEAAVKTKVEATRGYGATAVLHGGAKDLLPKARELQEQYQLTFVHPFDDPLVIAGQGTVGLEILEDVPAPDMVIVPVGGGGLISGIATVIKAKQPSTRVIGVEPTGAAAMIASLQQNKPVALEHINTVADGLAAPFAGTHALEHVQRSVDEVVLVTDEEIIEAMLIIMERSKLFVEPAAAAGFAALLHHKINVAPGSTVVCVLSGGNIDRTRLKTLL
jgi:threonine dehydratase